MDGGSRASHRVHGPTTSTPEYKVKHNKSSHVRGILLNSRALKLLLFFLGFLYVGVIFYCRSLLHERDDAFKSEKLKWSNELYRLHDQRSEELARSRKALTEMEKVLEQKDEALTKAEQRLTAMRNTVERLDENQLIQSLRDQNLLFNHLRWGEGPVRVLLELGGSPGTVEEAEEVEFELAPFELLPHVTHWFLTLVETGFWDGCHLIRNAPHVLQFNCRGRTAVSGNPSLLARVPGAEHGRITGRKSIVFQEFAPDFNHLPFTLGVAGRPGGEDFYVNLVDNTRNHGPGGQGPEPDPCFAEVVKGKDVLEKVHQKLTTGFLKEEDFVLIRRMLIKGEEKGT